MNKRQEQGTNVDPIALKEKKGKVITESNSSYKDEWDDIEINLPVKNFKTFKS